MERIDITSEEYWQLTEFLVPHPNTEGKLFINNNEIIKTFYNTSDYNLNGKKYIIQKVKEIENSFNIPYFVKINKLVYVDNVFCGYSMEYVNGITLREALQSDIPFETKKDYLKQLGSILLDMNKLRENPKFYNLHLNDINENNIIVKDHKLVIIDLDSCYLDNSIILPQKYFPKEKNNLKYEKTILTPLGFRQKPNYNSELYEYMIIVLSFILKESAFRLTVNEIRDYLEYLKSINYNDKVITSINSFYDDNIDNQNLLHVIDLLDDDKKVEYSEFKLNKRNK